MTNDVQLAGSPARRPALGAVARFGAGLIGSAVLGALGGLLWGEVAPRALLQQAGAGEASIVNAETRAFIGADVWFCGIAVVAGLITGVAGYRYLVARHDGAGHDGAGHDGAGHDGAGQPDERGHGRRAVAAAGLIAGSVAGSLVMMWIGGLIGLAGYNHALATSRTGAMFDSSLSLGAKSALAFWPLITATIISAGEWSVHRAAAARTAEPPAEPPLEPPLAAG